MDLLQIHIKELKVGNHIVNLGKVLEIEPSEYSYSIVIERLNQKQVFKFDSNEMLYINKN